MSAAGYDQDSLEHLLIRTAAQDQPAFAELYRRTSARLFGACWRMLRDREESQEVLQEAFTSVWRRASSFVPARAGALAWLIALTRNKAIDPLRQRRERVLDDPIDLEHESSSCPRPRRVGGRPGTGTVADPEEREAHCHRYDLHHHTHRAPAGRYAAPPGWSHGGPCRFS